MPLKTVIVEDELLSRMFLENLIAEFCPDIEIVAYATTEDEAVEAIKVHNPDLVFLDIELQQGSGFGVLKRISLDKLKVIFTTAYDHYAINAIILSGTDYLLKPFDYESLLQTVKNLCGQENTESVKTSLQYLLATLQNNNKPKHIAITTGTGLEFIPVDEVVRLEAIDTQVQFVLKSGTKTSSGVNIKQWEQLLAPHGFFRTHQAHIVNLSEIKNIASGIITMKDNSKVMISDRKLPELKNSALPAI